MRKYGIICLDLDGTLLTSKKQLSETNRKALEKAAAEGIEIVPATGRFYKGMPEVIRNLPFINYALTVNGACVEDLKNEKVVFSSELSKRKTLEIMTFLDTLPVIYDCYKDGWGWMSRDHYLQSELYAVNEFNLDMLLNLRTPVPDLKEMIRSGESGTQKVQAFFRDFELREKMLKEIPLLFPDTSVTTSNINNIEINSPEANKGNALMKLAEYLGVERENTMAFGDGINDITMLRDAGTGIAMGNASDEVKKAADDVTLSNDSDGVAAALNRILWEND